MSVAIVPMGKTFHANLSTIQWFMSGYGIGVASFLITAGKLADMYTHRRIMIIGVLVFSFSSMLIAVTPVATLVILWRVTQGIGGACCITAVLALINQSFPPAERNVPLSLTIASSGIGIAIGPLLGGFIIHYTTWPIVFWLNVPVGILSAYCIVKFFPPTEPGLKERRIDYLGMFLMTGTMVLITLGISQGNNWGWTDSGTLSCLCLSVILFGLFLWRQCKISYALLPLSLFRIKNFTIANVAGFSAYFILLSWIFVFSVYLPQVFQLTPLDTGLYEMPFSLAFFLTGLYSGKLINITSIKSVMIAGFIILFAGTLYLTFTGVKTTYEYLAIGFGLIGMGFVYVNGSSMPAAIEFLPPDQVGAASGTSMLFRWFGAAIGVAIISTVYGAATFSDFNAQLRQHASWLTHISMQQYGSILLGHQPKQQLQNILDKTQYHAVLTALHHAYSHGVMVSMRVLTVLSACTLLLTLIFIKRPAPN